jgi:ABC-type polysaccharide/polyol phosphate export permease
MIKAIKELFAYRELLWNLVLNELKLRYRNSFLGFLWTVLNPLFYLLILALVFSRIIRFQMENYTIFLFTGLVSWGMIQQTITTATASIVNNQALIRKVHIPKMVFPLSNVIARYIDHLILTLILLVFMVVFRMPFSWYLALLPILVLIHFVFSLGISLICAVAYIKVRDVQHIVAIIFQALFFLTPIIYSVDILPKSYRPLFLLNPFYYFVQIFRFPVYYAALPSWKIISATLILTAGAIVFGGYIFYKKEKYFVFHLS